METIFASSWLDPWTGVLTPMDSGAAAGAEVQHVIESPETCNCGHGHACSLVCACDCACELCLCTRVLSVKATTRAGCSVLAPRRFMPNWLPNRDEK